jgi:hypothetical protein
MEQVRPRVQCDDPAARNGSADRRQHDEVHKRRKARESLRAIAAATGLSLQTVRTIISRADKEAKRTNELRHKEFDRLRATAYRARKRARDGLPKQIAELQNTGAALVKPGKGLGR